MLNEKEGIKTARKKGEEGYQINPQFFISKFIHISSFLHFLYYQTDIHQE